MTLLWKLGLGGLGLAAVVFSVYIGWKWVRGLLASNKVLKSIGNLRMARIKALETELATRHAEERKADETAATTARTSAAAAAEWLRDSGGTGGHAGGPMHPTEPASTPDH